MAETNMAETNSVRVRYPVRRVDEARAATGEQWVHDYLAGASIQDLAVRAGAPTVSSAKDFLTPELCCVDEVAVHIISGPVLRPSCAASSTVTVARASLRWTRCCGFVAWS